jgi:hypothetical protein
VEKMTDQEFEICEQAEREKHDEKLKEIRGQNENQSR